MMHPKFSNILWKEKEFYMELMVGQLSTIWYKEKKHFSVSASSISDFINLTQPYSNTFTGACYDGITHEHFAREYYEKEKNVKVNEVGLFSPKWDYRICCSPDGFVGNDGIIEIKCPRRLYQSLMEKDEVPIKHMCQIQCNLAITKRKWCDYVVYPLDSSYEVYIKRIDFNEEFWNVIYHKTKEILDEKPKE